MKSKNIAKTEKPQDFLLEIGCEEIPADYLPSVLDWPRQGPTVAGGLASSTVVVFEGEGIVWENLESFATFRRLVLLVQGVQPTVRKWEKGPQVAIAYDAQGKPTRAAEAFAARHGVKVSELKRQDAQVYAEYDVPAVEVLSKAVPEIIRRIMFPKTMRWDDSGIRFARPIRWLLALYGSRLVPCVFGNVSSGAFTYGTRYSGNKSIKVSSAEQYFSKLADLHVELEQGLVWKWQEKYRQKAEERYPVKAKALAKSLEQVAKSEGGKLQDQKSEEFEWLLRTVTFLAENPVVKAGSFRKEFLELPPEVLATAMAKYLKLFSVYSSDGKYLLPKFLAVLEGQPTNVSKVLANHQRILEARFFDAQFFYREDVRTRLEEKVSQLSKVVFHQKLGTVSDRIPRLERLMMAIAKQINLRDSLSGSIPQVAQLAKVDLVTQMVREFPSLQGTMGGYYARHDKEPEEVISALREQYRPRTASDRLPCTPLGRLLSLADRLDGLIGFFGIGLKPTSSLDPYGLRRQAIGAVHILISSDSGILPLEGLSIDSILKEGIQSWDSKLTLEPEVVQSSLKAFLKERFEWVAVTLNGIRPEFFDAIIAAGDNDLARAWKRLGDLTNLWKDSREMLMKAGKVAERTGRIVANAKEIDIPQSVDVEALKDSSEKVLWLKWKEIQPNLESQIKHRDFKNAVNTYSQLYEPVDIFFKAVMVMDNNLDIRRNRLALMNELYKSIAVHFADLSKLPLSGVE